MTKILVLDNYDSFVYTLNGYLQQLGAETDVIRNDAFEASELPALMAKYDGVLISPGPGTPADAGLSIPVVKEALVTNQPVFGVCLGHQAIAEAFGGKLYNLEEVQHGVASTLTVVPDRLFAGLPSHFAVGRYHSWVVDEAYLPADLEVIGRTPDQQIMAIRHKQYDLRGLQFHPESILTEHGSQLIQNWLQS